MQTWLLTQLRKPLWKDSIMGMHFQLNTIAEKSFGAPSTHVSKPELRTLASVNSMY